MTTQPSRVVAGCAGTIVGGLLGCFLGGVTGNALGLRPTGSLFFFALDLLFYLCVGGGGIIGAIAGRVLGVSLAKLRKGSRSVENPDQETR